MFKLENKNYFVEKMPDVYRIFSYFRSSAMDPLKKNLDREFERMDKMFNHLMRSTLQGFRSVHACALR